MTSSFQDHNMAQFESAEQKSGGGGGKIVLFFVGLGLGFIVGNLIVYNFDRGIFEDRTQESKLLVDSLKTQVGEKEEAILQLQKNLEDSESKLNLSQTAYEELVAEKKTSQFQLIMTEPAPGTEVDGDVVTIKGSSSKPNITLTINRHQNVIVNTDGSFSFDYPLIGLENQIDVYAFANDHPEEKQTLSWKILKKAHWKEVAHFKGSDGKINTAKFELKGSEAKFTVRPQQAGNYLNATLYRTPDLYEELLYNKANKNLKMSDEIKFYKNGEFYISVFSINTNWEIVVESLE